MKSKRLYVIGLAGLLLLAAAPIALAQVRTASQSAAQVRKATAGYHDLNAAAADGYAQFLTCMQLPGQGAMGIHFVKDKLVGDALLDPLQPEALLYEPQNGKLQLAAVEYVVMVDAWRVAGHTGAPSLFGQAFNFNDSPNMFGLPPFYSLHAWVWKANPAGMFAPWNPAVSCPMNMEMERQTHVNGQ